MVDGELQSSAIIHGDLRAVAREHQQAFLVRGWQAPDAQSVCVCQQSLDLRPDTLGAQRHARCVRAALVPYTRRGTSPRILREPALVNRTALGRTYLVSLARASWNRFVRQARLCNEPRAE